MCTNKKAGVGVQSNAMQETYAFATICACFCSIFATKLTERRPLQKSTGRRLLRARNKSRCNLYKRTTSSCVFGLSRKVNADPRAQMASRAGPGGTRYVCPPSPLWRCKSARASTETIGASCTRGLTACPFSSTLPACERLEVSGTFPVASRNFMPCLCI